MNMEIAQAEGAFSQVLPNIGFLRLPQVLALYPVGKTSWYDGITSGRYPKPVKLSERTSAWRVEDIKKLIEETGASK